MLSLLLAAALALTSAKGGQDEPIPISPICITFTFDDGTPDLHLGVPLDPPLVSTMTTAPLEPQCNQCLVGTYCIVNAGQPPFTPTLDCCNGNAGNCLKCSICKVQPIDGTKGVLTPDTP